MCDLGFEKCENHISLISFSRRGSKTYWKEAEENQRGWLERGQKATLSLFPSSMGTPWWHPPEVARQPLFEHFQGWRAYNFWSNQLNEDLSFSHRKWPAIKSRETGSHSCRTSSVRNKEIVWRRRFPEEANKQQNTSPALSGVLALMLTTAACTEAVGHVWVQWSTFQELEITCNEMLGFGTPPLKCLFNPDPVYMSSVWKLFHLKIPQLENAF